MKHGNFDKIPKDYKTFAELAEYARKRAKVSAARNGHQEFVYWFTVFAWARDCHEEYIDAVEEFRFQRERLDSPLYDEISKAESHAFAVHLRQMLINRGEKPPRLSLAWLREAAKKL